MQLHTLLLVVACSSALFTHVHSAHSAYCTTELNGTGPSNYQITKDCCAATREHRTTAFWESDHKCFDAAGFGNGINLGRFVKCCGERGAGSHSDG